MTTCYKPTNASNSRNNMPNEIDEFFKGLPSTEKPIVQNPETPEEGEQQVQIPENTDEPRKNRRHRRLESQLQEEREARIRAEALLEASSESTRFSRETGEVDPRFLAIYGDKPETHQAWKIQQEMLLDYKEQAKAEALDEIRNQQVVSQQQQREYESFIDSELEEIEDEFNIDVTSDAPAARKARREFLEMVHDASPKDENGEITAYADFPSVWEFYQLKQTKDKGSTRNREISSRTMARTNGASETAPKITPGFDGWRKDYGMN